MVMHSIDLLSYNLNFHVAYSELLSLTKKHSIDILCLQECFADDISDNLAGLSLAAKTTTGKLGLAIYCDSSRFKLKSSVSIPIQLSTYEKIRTHDRERLLIVELFDNSSQQSLFVASFHATHLVATNNLRRKQLSLALATLNTLHSESPVVLTGDFNYPFFHRKLKETAQKFKYHLIMTDEPTFHGRKFSGRFDMVATTHLNTYIQALPFGLSDHTPVLIHLTDAN